ncbi:MAG: TonB family protein [Bacteroidales bacterium]|nr:TonB family protein [Bacteroidales bacterium]
MNETLIYLLKVSAAIALVTLPYYLVLRNDANLVVKRIYLVTGILLSWIFPLLSVRKPGIISSMDPVFLVDPVQSVGTAATTAGTATGGISAGSILAILYLAGILAFIILNVIALSRVRKQVSRTSGKKNVLLTNSEKVFTIYPNIFLPEKYASAAENDAILIHERAHIRQLHMADLLISEFSLALTWFNPFSWLISRMIKENHEHLADREVLTQGVHPAHYKSQLLNHALGGEVFRLGHQFNHSLTKKRFNMMKKMKAKKKGVLKYILFVPTILAFTLMATAAGQQARTIEGKVYLETTDVPAFGASVIIAGTTMGTFADKEGAFTLEVTGNPEIAISFVGYETALLTAREIDRKPVVLVPASYEIVFDERPIKKTEIIELEVIKKKSEAGTEAETVKMRILSDDGIRIQSDNGKAPVYVVDGKVVKSIEDIDAEKIEQVKVIKDTNHPVVKKYNAENGVLLITLKEDAGDMKNCNNNSTDRSDSQEEVKVVRVKVIEEIETNDAAETGSAIKKEIEIEVDADGDVDMDGDAAADADAEADAEVEEDVFIVVEDVPMFPGGRAALGQYIDTHLEYPAEASRKKIAGKVMVEFKVQTDGSLDELRVAQSSNDIFNKAALAVFEDIPAWKPAKQRGKPVSCKVIIPVRFTPGEE